MSLATDSEQMGPARLAGSVLLASQSDDRLVALFRDGHERAFDAIVSRYRRPLTRYCARILPESRCEDAVQQAFINAHKALADSADELQLRPWLYAITRNAALNMLRQNGWNYEEIPLDFDGVRRPDQVVEQRIELEQTVAAVNELPDRQRDAIVMREFEGRSYEEIALALGTGDGAVRQLLNRARVTLRNVATAAVPPPLVTRLATSLPASDGRRTAEIIGGLGGAGLAKAGATALVAGTLVVGAVEAPLPLHPDSHATREKATLAASAPAVRKHVVAKAASAGVFAPVAAGRHSSAPAVTDHRGRSGSSHSGSGSHGAAQVEHHRSSEHHSGSGDGSSGSHSDGSQRQSDDSPTRSVQSPSRSGSSGRRGSDDGSRSGDNTLATGFSGSDDGLQSGSSGSSDSSGSSGSGSPSGSSDGSSSGSTSGGGGDTSTTPTTSLSSGSSTSDSGSTSTSGGSGSLDQLEGH